MNENMKGITCCADCDSFHWNLQKCLRGAKEEGDPQQGFFRDCPLPDVKLCGIKPKWDGKFLRCGACDYVLKKVWKFCPKCGSMIAKNVKPDEVKPKTLIDYLWGDQE